jgi:hypothetical protein
MGLVACFVCLSMRTVLVCLFLLVNVTSSFNRGFSKLSLLRPGRSQLTRHAHQWGNTPVHSIVPGHHLYRMLGIDPDASLDRIKDKVKAVVVSD